jgi:hypothetical protein
MRRRAVSLRHARRLCAATGTVSSPFLDGRKSVPITFPHQHACKPWCDRIPKVSMQPASLGHRSSTRSQTVRRHGHSPTTASRRSKIGPITFRRQHACKPWCDRKPKMSMQPASLRYRSSTRSQTVRRHGYSPTTASRRSKIGHVDQPRQHACKPRYDRIPEVSKHHAPPPHELLTHSRTLCEAAGTVPPPLLDKRKSVTSA